MPLSLWRPSHHAEIQPPGHIRVCFNDDAIITPLEQRISYGIGKCGRCNVGSEYVCNDGPVFTLRQIKQMQENVLS